MKPLLAVLLLLFTTSRALAVASCTTSATPVGFGVYDPLSGTARTTTGTVTVACSLIGGVSLLVSYNIKLSAGGGTFTNRLLSSGSGSLSYNLYTTNTYATVWGDGTGATSVVSDGYLLGIGGATLNYTVYGRIPASQNVAAASYADSIIVTVTY
jgi:spore coat protein U-like protein